MFLSFTKRLLQTANKRALWKFAWNFGFKGALSVERFKRRLRRGEWFPPFVHSSITNRCNLRCQGCWVDVDAPEERIDLPLMDRVITDSKKHGNRVFGILGGEPFLHPDWFELLARHPECYFQVFTNGQPITAEVAASLLKLGNVSPLISIEGREQVSDERRGNKEVFSRSMRGLEHCVRAGLITGVASSICRNNIDDLLSEDWLRELIARGVHYVWYYAYRPVGANMGSDLALSPDQLLRFRRFIVEARPRFPLAILDTYYDHQGRALCPMAAGLSHHINPRGEIEPCPVIQFARENIKDHPSVYHLMTQSAFLSDFRKAAREATRGCVVLERPDLIKQIVLQHQARDTTGRGTALAELDRMQRHSSQFLPGQEIPETYWFYRLAKAGWFNSFGAYKGSVFPPQTVLDPACKMTQTAEHAGRG